jgi:probable F420-dependent oxidoreductase
VKFWCSIAFLDPDQVLDVARASEACGYHGVMVADHVVFPENLSSAYPYSANGAPGWEAETAWLDAWVAIGAMAAVTSTLRFSTNVYIAPARHPLVVAKAVATAAVLSGGRVALGGGVGWMREEFAALDSDFTTRGRRFDEMIDILRALWTGEAVEHHSAFYDFDRLRMSPVPSAPIPIYTGGDSDAALRRAARVDGWIGSLYRPEVALTRVADLGRFRRDIGVSATDGQMDDYEIILALRGPIDDLDAYRRLEDAGVTGIMTSPLAVRSLAVAGDEVPAHAVETFADRVIARLG